jgi:hypothetical protein
MYDICIFSNTLLNKSNSAMTGYLSLIYLSFTQRFVIIENNFITYDKYVNVFMYSFISLYLYVHTYYQL